MRTDISPVSSTTPSTVASKPSKGPSAIRTSSPGVIQRGDSSAAPMRTPCTAWTRCFASYHGRTKKPRRPGGVRSAECYCAQPITSLYIRSMPHSSDVMPACIAGVSRQPPHLGRKTHKNFTEARSSRQTLERPSAGPASRPSWPSVQTLLSAGPAGALVARPLRSPLSYAATARPSCSGRLPCRSASRFWRDLPAPRSPPAESRGPGRGERSRVRGTSRSA